MAALDGMRVLDVTQYEAGTSCTQALAWLGADVVKVEPPGLGDPGRHVQPGEGNSPYFLNFNSNKRSIVLDLQDPRGREMLLRLAPQYDVFVENYAPGVVEKLDIGPDVLRQANPRIIYGRLKGFGLSGPYSQFKAFDPIAQAAAGAIALTGPDDGPPVYPASMTGDSGTGVQLALAIVAAYVECQRTGAGQVIEISMQEAMTFFMRTRVSSTIWNTRPALGRGSSNRSGAGPATVRMYPCQPQGLNDYVFIMCTTQRMWDLPLHHDRAARSGARSAIRDRHCATRTRQGAGRGDRRLDAGANEGRSDAAPWARRASRAVPSLARKISSLTRTCASGASFRSSTIPEHGKSRAVGLRPSVSRTATCPSFAPRSWASTRTMSCGTIWTWSRRRSTELRDAGVVV